MKIKKNSWHARFYGWANNGQYPKSLCSYFWNIIGAIFLFPLWIIPHAANPDNNLDKKIAEGGTGLLLMFSNFFVGMILLAPSLGTEVWWIWLVANIVVPTVGFCAFLIIAGVCGLLDMVSGPNLVSNYIKAKKRKICPLIEFVDKIEQKD